MASLPPCPSAPSPLQAHWPPDQVIPSLLVSPILKHGSHWESQQGKQEQRSSPTWQINSTGEQVAYLVHKVDCRRRWGWRMWGVCMHVPTPGPLPFIFTLETQVAAGKASVLLIFWSTGMGCAPNTSLKVQGSRITGSVSGLRDLLSSQHSPGGQDMCLPTPPPLQAPNPGGLLYHILRKPSLWLQQSCGLISRQI